MRTTLTIDDDVAAELERPRRTRDASPLIYSKTERFPQHRTTRDWFNHQLSSAQRVGIPWPSLLGFLRVVTNPRILVRPSSPADAWNAVMALVGFRPLWVPPPHT